MKPMKTALALIVIMFALSLNGCGDNAVVIDVDLPLNQASPFAELTITGGASVFFQFDALLPNPVTINDIDPSQSSIQIPSTVPFSEPNKSSYDLSQAPLNEDTAYRVTMFGTLDPTTNIAKYKGVGDCPLKLANGSNNSIHVCFGLNSTTETPLCPDTLAFIDCPK